jgi:hypothetical protein
MINKVRTGTQACSSHFQCLAERVIFSSAYIFASDLVGGYVEQRR